MEYLIADTHFNHENIKKYCSRPDNHEELISNSLSQLKETDALIHLGDICFGADKEVHKKFIQPIKSQKTLVLGNHDRKSRSWYLDNGWDFVCYSFYDNYYGLKVKFSHKPSLWDGQFDVNIHGHLHNLGHHITAGNCLNHLICIEDLNYKLTNLQELIERIKNKSEEN